MKAAVSQNEMLYLPSRFSGWVKAFKLVSVFSNVFLIFFKNLQKILIFINDYGGVQ